MAISGYLDISKTSLKTKAAKKLTHNLITKQKVSRRARNNNFLKKIQTSNDVAWSAYIDLNISALFLIPRYLDIFVMFSENLL